MASSAMFSEAPPDSIPIGYTALVHQFGLRTLPHHRGSFISTKGGPRELKDGRVVLRPDFPPATTVLEHLTFSLKHDGLNLAILAAVFNALDDVRDFEMWLAKGLLDTPNGIYLRRLWFLYEWLTDRTIGVSDSNARYIPLLDAEEHVTGADRPSQRHRVINNLLGERAFCPMVRKTEALKQHDPSGLFIKLCLQSGGSLSATKRSSHFDMLDDDELKRLEAAVRDNMPPRAASRA